MVCCSISFPQKSSWGGKKITGSISHIRIFPAPQLETSDPTEPFAPAFPEWLWGTPLWRLWQQMPFLSASLHILLNKPVLLCDLCPPVSSNPREILLLSLFCLKSRERWGERIHLLICSPYLHNSRSRPIQSQEPGTQSQSSTWVVGTQVLEPLICYFTGQMLVGRWDQKQSWDMNQKFQYDL